MKMVKSLLLGTAAGVVAMTGAQAADLPVKAKAVEYVKICSLYGKGFYYIPGTDICLRLAGRVRYDYTVNGNDSQSFYLTGANARHTRSNDWVNDRARGYYKVDTRQQTAYGTLRTYVSVYFATSNGANFFSNERAFIQFAGFTFGKAVSMFDFWVTPRYSNQTNVISSDTGGSGINIFAYTAQLGNGLSISLSAEDESRRRKIVGDINSAAFAAAAITTGGFANQYAGTSVPDFVANLRVDQGWGSAQIMGAIHEVSANYYTVGGVKVEGNGSPSDEWGWAFGAGLHLKVPTGPKDTFTVQGAWTSGALSYAMSGPPGGQGVAVYSGTNYALGVVSDGVYNAAGTSIELTDAWSVVAGYQHWWVPNLRTSVFGGYLDVSYNGTATGWLNASFGCPAGGNCDPDWQLWQIGTRTVWTPVPGLDFSVDVIYSNIETSYAGQTCFACAPGGFKPVANYTLTDQDWVQAIFRVERNY